jgi:predicted transglutaminase-like cysteine proteinase
MLVRFAGAAAFSAFIAFALAGAGAADISGRPQEAGFASLPSNAMRMAPLHIEVGGLAKAPLGWTDFCTRYAQDCERETFTGQIIVLDAATRDLLQRVNLGVNVAIKATIDWVQWATAERWDYAETGLGDCEDYALLKQRWLVSAGLHRDAVLVTVVTDLAGDGHAVLTVRTDQGDFILDNMVDDMKLWRETPYSFVKRQSSFVSTEWVSLNGGGASPAMVSR